MLLFSNIAALTAVVDRPENATGVVAYSSSIGR